MVKKQFRISSALKNIIGKDLITSDFVAVFELVKNAFDANATDVDLTFLDLDGPSPKLIIQDNGKGMDLEDFESKWLFVAYSAKKEGVENYRDTIKSNRVHAGAKGIGRFSCDKLGNKLKILSKRNDAKSQIHLLEIEWSDFESDSSQEFTEIPIQYSEVKTTPYDIQHGTVLEISGLREIWTREKLLKLRHSLEKLINPNQHNDSENFSIHLHAPSEAKEDQSVAKDEPWNIVNGSIKNFLFENLGLKTTFINVKITADGKFIKSRLEDRGTLIFEITENNNLTYDGHHLSNIEVTLFALNRNAKSFFTKHMGTQPVNFGSLLLYKDGFRVHPIGEYRDDSFGLDRRKTQGTARFLGNRDIVGRIEINGSNPYFTEASSRDGGLVKNAAYECLQVFFLEFCLRRLEKYAVDIVKYGNIGDDFESAVSQNSDIKSQVLSLVQNLTQSRDIVDLSFDPKVVDILGELSERSLQAVLKNFSRIAAETNNHILAKEAEKAKQRLEQLNKARKEAEAETKKARKEQADAEAKAKDAAEKAKIAQAEAELAAQSEKKITSENIFLKSMVSADLSNVLALHHHIGIAAETIENYIKNMSTRIRSGQAFSEETVLKLLHDISIQTKKIQTTTKWATKANFTLEAAKINGNICAYIEEYLLNICSGIIKTKNNKENIVFIWNNPNNIEFLLKYRPLELSIVIDNLISNARKANATEIKMEVLSCSPKELLILFSDNGDGISNTSKRKIFDLAYTTTDGSGLGLHQTKDIMRSMNGDIELVHPAQAAGATFQLRFRS